MAVVLRSEQHFLYPQLNTNCFRLHCHSEAFTRYSEARFPVIKRHRFGLSNQYLCIKYNGKWVSENENNSSSRRTRTIRHLGHVMKQLVTESLLRTVYIYIIFFNTFSVAGTSQNHPSSAARCNCNFVTAHCLPRSVVCLQVFRIGIVSRHVANLIHRNVLI